jgi:hypothetical protein
MRDMYEYGLRGGGDLLRDPVDEPAVACEYSSNTSSHGWNLTRPPFVLTIVGDFYDTATVQLQNVPTGPLPEFSIPPLKTWFATTQG